MRQYVVDASIAVKWFVPEVHWAAAGRVIDPNFALAAPDLLAAETGNILWKKVRRGEIAAREASEIIAALRALGLDLTPSAELLPAALELAVALDHPVYDCLYLALAIARGCPLFTADAEFHAAVQASPYSSHILWVEDEL